MTKKQFVIDMLVKLEPYRALAKDLKKFVMLDVLDNSAVNGIIQLLKEMAVFMENKQAKHEMLEIAKQMEKMKELELQDHIQDEQEVENLLLNL